MLKDEIQCRPDALWRHSGAPPVLPCSAPPVPLQCRPAAPQCRLWQSVAPPGDPPVPRRCPAGAPLVPPKNPSDAPTQCPLVPPRCPSGVLVGDTTHDKFTGACGELAQVAFDMVVKPLRGMLRRTTYTLTTALRPIYALLSSTVCQTCMTCSAQKKRADQQGRKQVI